MASVCGAESCADVAGFAEDRETLLTDFLRMKNGVLNLDTFGHVFRLQAGRTSTSTSYYLSSARLSPEALARAVRVDETLDEDRARNRRDHGPEKHPPPDPHPAQQGKAKVSAARKGKRSR